MDSPATTAAIAAVIEAHTPTGYEGNVTCWCGGPRFKSWAEHSEHVAAAVLAALPKKPAQVTHEDLWDAHECVLYWRESDNCDDTPENRKRLLALAKRLKDASNALALRAGDRS